MEWLKNIRLAKGLTQEQVANAIGITRAAYGNIETGKRTPKPQLAQRIGKYLSVDWTRFYANCSKAG